MSMYRSYYLSSVSGCTLLYEVIRRALNFIVDFLNSDCNMISFIVYHAVLSNRSEFILGTNVVLFSLRYNQSLTQLLKQKRRYYLFDTWALSQLSDKDWLLIWSTLETLIIRDKVLHVF